MDEAQENADSCFVMPKKAGPKHLDPNTFRPVLWMDVDTKDLALVCGRRTCVLNPIFGPNGKDVRAADFVHLIAIAYAPDLVIARPLTIDYGTWKKYPPQSLALSYRGAQVALAEAWHGVDPNLDLSTMRMNAVYKPTLENHKGGVRIRNIIAALHWNVWDILGTSIEDRARILTSHGHKCNAAQLTRFAIDRGLPVSCITPRVMRLDSRSPQNCGKIGRHYAETIDSQ